jgi:hypothetical protein
MTLGMSLSLSLLATTALRLVTVEERELLGIDTKEFRESGKGKEGTHGCGVPENFSCCDVWEKPPFFV